MARAAAHDGSIDDLIQRILDEARRDAGAAYTSKTYADQPILRTGRDLEREQLRKRSEQEAEKRRREREEGRRRLRQHPRGSARPRLSAQDLAYWDRVADTPAPPQEPSKPSSPAPLRNDHAPSPQDARPSSDRGGVARAVPARPEPEPLPEPLRQLRALASETDGQGRSLPQGELFWRQARLAADATDDVALDQVLPFRHVRGYQDLSDHELREYFSWRTSWRAGNHASAPAAFALLLAFELIDGVGAEEGAPAQAELEALADATLNDSWGMGVTWNISMWARNYGYVHGILARTPAAARATAYSEAVVTLRQAERAVLAAEGLRGLSPADAPAMPPDKDLCQAFCAVSTFSPEHSPFVRGHEESFCAVVARVFSDLALHCARRRKTCLVDGIVGFEQTVSLSPFVGVPLPAGWQGKDRVMRLAGGRWVSLEGGRWRLHQPFEETVQSRDVGKILRAIDRQMRHDWQEGRQLKEIRIPKYVQRMIGKRSAERHGQELEREKRRFTVDVSKLGAIRSSAAQVREALLVDEEREDYGAGRPVYAGPDAGTPAGTAAPGAQDGLPAEPESASPAAAPGQAPVPAAAAPDPGPEAPAAASMPTPGGSSVGLSAEEEALLRSLLDGTGYQPGPGAPTTDLLADAINEKCFDVVGDVVVEFSDAGEPVLVEDYEQDVRGILNP